MGSKKLHLGFVKYGWVLSVMGYFPIFDKTQPYLTNPTCIFSDPICDKTQAHFWRYRNEYVYIQYGSVKNELGICHIWGQRSYIWDLSNMGGFCHGFCQLGFVKYGRQDLSIIGGQEGTLALICYYYLEASVPCALFLGVCQFDWGLSYMG